MDKDNIDEIFKTWSTQMEELNKINFQLVSSAYSSLQLRYTIASTKLEELSNKISQLEDTNCKSQDTINNQLNIINDLKCRVRELVEEKKSKSSSALWETTTVQLKEKDQIIEGLKKDIEFYKRTQTKSLSPVSAKYQANLTESKESEKYSQNKIVLDEENLENTVEIFNNEPIVDNFNDQNIEPIVDNLNVEIILEQNTEKKKKKKLKSEKKSKVIKDNNLDDLNDMDKLERELAEL
jgi:hypothetical protein